MDERTQDRRTQLLEQERLEGPGRERCEREIAALFTRKLSALDRWRYAIPACGGLAGAIVLGPLALSEPASTPWSTRAILLCLAALGLCWFAVCWRVLRRGSVDLIGDRRRIAWIALLACLGQVAVLSFAATRDAAALPGLLLALGLLVVASTLFVLQRMAEHRARQREEFLRLELGMSARAQRGAQQE